MTEDISENFQKGRGISCEISSFHFSSKMWISIEGCIGAGKTTFIDKVLIHLVSEYKVIPEPVEEWEKEGILKDSYTNPACVFPAQCVFFTSRIEKFRSLYDPNIVNFSERSPFTDKLFWNIQKLDVPWFHNAYLSMWKEWQNLMPIKCPNFFIYLRSDTSVSMNRLKERNRESETTVTFEYQEKLKEQHEDNFKAEGTIMPDGTKVACLIINVNNLNYHNDVEVAKDVAGIIQRIIDRIKEKINL
jgi:deoxyadenosine/deoxycytidine kinase